MNAAPVPPGYPVNLDFDENQTLNRAWGIPIFGIMVRAILVIPHVICLWFLGIAAFLVQLVAWIPVLLSGRYPSWGYTIVGGFMRWSIRVQAWVLLMAGPYPPFGLDAPYPIDLDFESDQQMNPLWGIPLLGIVARAILAIPHFIVLWIFSIVVWLLQWIVWIPVLLNGRYPKWGYEIVGGYLRWQNRLAAYIGLLAAPYPPFRAGD